MATEDPPAAAERPLRRDAERNRQRILEGARELFAARGLDVTLDDIAHHAGVGIGTIYRRFPDKEVLIDALFEAKIDEIAAVAEAALRDPDPWQGLVRFLEGSIALQAADRGLREVALGRERGRERVLHARGRMAPFVAQLVLRAQAAGALRADVAVPDFPLVQVMLMAVVDISHDIEPELWRRLLAILLDGLVEHRDGPTPLPVGPLTLDEAADAMRRWRPPR